VAAAAYGIYVYNVRLARRIHNQALLAAAQDNRSDALVSIGAAIGIFGSRLGADGFDVNQSYIFNVHVHVEPDE
jgi:divalent metal cation (Fe/Co/Zn/Cd) transporter